jgi:hypothetical protein
MGDLIDLKEFQTIQEWKNFAEKQLLTIQFLQSANSELQKEISKLKDKMNFQGPVEKVIISPEQALLDDQILIIQQRAYLKELNLEDVKKLDILLKNKKILKDEAKLLEGKSKPAQLSNEELLKIVHAGVSNES